MELSLPVQGYLYGLYPISIAAVKVGDYLTRAHQMAMSEAGLFASILKFLVNVLTAPLWFLDAIDKESFVLALPTGFRRQLLRVLFWPTLLWTLMLHRLMPDNRRWYDRVDNRVIIGNTTDSNR